jgi:carbonic anhydrase/acetyltransferase-like protein (isoleucine patch superfamily)
MPLIAGGLLMADGKVEAGARAAAPLSAPRVGGGAPFLLPYASVSPQFGSPPTCGPGAAVLGRATIGARARLGAFSVIRADGHFVRIADDFSLGSRSTVHIAHDVFPAIIGDRVSVGENAVVHACTLGNDVVVGDGAVILDGSVVADRVVIEPHSIVFPRSELAGGKLYAGMPARPVRDLCAGEIEERAAELRRRGHADSARPALTEGDLGACLLVAATARLRGRVVAGQDCSIWFGCDLDANGGEIAIGENTNIQDNTMIRCRPGRRFAIGENSTIGHNVTLGDCTIGARSLIGIGSVVAAGVVIEDDVFLAAGAETTKDQVLERGFLWGKRPAVKMAPLDAAKRELIAMTVEHYRGYARAFAAAQRS